MRNNKENKKPEWCTECKFITVIKRRRMMYKITDFKTFASEKDGRHTIPIFYCGILNKEIGSGVNPPKWCPFEEERTIGFNSIEEVHNFFNCGKD